MGEPTPTIVTYVRNVLEPLCEKPEAMTIDHTIDEKGVLLTLKVAKEDVGRVIGKAGANAQAVRSLLHTLGGKDQARYSLKIESEGW